MFIQEIIFECVGCKMSAILSRFLCVKSKILVCGALPVKVTPLKINGAPGNIQGNWTSMLSSSLGVNYLLRHCHDWHQIHYKHVIIDQRWTTTKTTSLVHKSHVHLSATKWYIVGYLSFALRDLCNRSLLIASMPYRGTAKVYHSAMLCLHASRQGYFGSVSGIQA